jgi:hypothetical protein
VALRGSRSGRWPAVTVAIAAIAFASLAGAATGEAAPIRIGPVLPVSGSSAAAFCSVACTFLNTGTTKGVTLASPVDGAVIAWRIRGGTAGGRYDVRVMTPESGTTVRAGAASSPGLPLSSGTETFPADLPIKAGQLLAVDVPGESNIGDTISEGSVSVWIPALAEGSLATYPEAIPSFLLGYDADVLPVPTVSSIGPMAGPTAGGTTTVLEGSNFEEVRSVTFGSAPASSYTVDSDSRITAVSPPGASGNAVVRVTTAAGTADPPEPFVYEATPPPAETHTDTPSGPGPAFSIGAPAPSGPRFAFAIGAPSIDRRNGTAKLPVTVPGPGTVTVRATGTKTPTHLRQVAMTVDGPSTVGIPLSVTAAGAEPLRRNGSIRLVPLVTFTPAAGAPAALFRPVVLRRDP